MTALPWHAWAVLLAPHRVRANLARVVPAGLATNAPSLWQVELAVLRMWHRILFRSDTIGTCANHPVRPTWRARLLKFRPFRLPFLLWERAITPWDLSGLLSSPQQITRHLLAAHHDGTQCVYDLQLLALYPGALANLRGCVESVVEREAPRSNWLRDLVVFTGYHEGLLAAVDRVMAGEQELSPDDAENPDISLRALLGWCSRQPDSPADTWIAWREGRFCFPHGLA
jgi:hypothetical protein